MRSTIVVSLRSKGIPGFNKRAVLDVRQQAIAMAVEIADIFKAALTTFANLSWTAWIAIALTIITTGADFTVMPNKTDSSIFLVFFAFITLPLLAMTILVVQRRDTAHTRLGQAKAALVAISLQASTAWATAASIAAAPQHQHASWGEHAAQAQSTMDVAADVRHSLAAVVDDLHRYLSHKRPNARHFLVPYKSSHPAPGNPLFQVSREMGVLLRKLHRSIRLLHLNTHQLQQAVTAQPSSHPDYAGTSPWPPQTPPWHPSPALNHHRTSPAPLGPSPSLAPSPPLMPDPRRSVAPGNPAQPTPQQQHPDPSEHCTRGAGGVGSYHDTQGGMHSAAPALMQGDPLGAAAGVEAVATQQGGVAAGGQPGAGTGPGPGQQGQWGGWVAEGAAGRGQAAGLSGGVDSGQRGPGQADEGGGQQWGGWGGWSGAGGAGVVMGLLLGQHVVRLHEAVEALSTIKELRTPVLLRAVQRWFVVVLMPAFLAHFWMAAAKGLGAALAGTMGVLLQLSLMVLMDVAISLEDPFDEAALDGISCFEALDHIAAMTSEEGMEAEDFPALVPRSTAVPAYFMPRSWQSGGERTTPGQPPDSSTYNSGGEGTWWSKSKSRRRDDQADARDDDVSGREAGTDYEHVFLDGYNGSGGSRPTPAMPPMPPLPQAYSAAQDLGLVGSKFGGRPR